MFAYGIGILPLVKQLKAEFPDVTQPWYDGYSGALVTFSNIELYFSSLKLLDPVLKSVLILHPDNIEVGKRFMG